LPYHCHTIVVVSSLSPHGSEKKAGVPNLPILPSSSQHWSIQLLPWGVLHAMSSVVSDDISKQNGCYARAVVVNSGCANAVIGKQGLNDAWAIVREYGICWDSLGLHSPPPKQLHATLLGCIMTDAAVSPHSLQNAFTYAIDRSFISSISVDGDMTTVTNDSIYILANGAVSNGFMIDEEYTRDAYKIFKHELTDFAADLAKLVVRDGEGATKFVTVTYLFPLTSLTGSRVLLLTKMLTMLLHRYLHRLWLKRLFTEKMQSTLISSIRYYSSLSFFFFLTSWGRILAATGSISFLPSSAGAPAPIIDPRIPSKVNITFEQPLHFLFWY
jgi:ArgJ family